MPMGAWAGLANMFMAGKSNKALSKLLEEDPTYTENPYAANQLGLARQMFYGRMFGAQDAERNILANQGNQISNINKFATDASQALALSAQAGGNTDQSFSDLQSKEAQNKYGLLSNLNAAYGAMINEGDKVYQDKVRRFGDKASIKGAKIANISNGIQSTFNGLNSDFNDTASMFGIMQGGGMGGFGGGKQSPQQSSYGGGWSYPGWSPKNRYDNMNP